MYQYSQLLSSTNFAHKKVIFNTLLISGNTFLSVSGCHFPQCGNNRFLKGYEIHLINNFIDRHIKWKCAIVSNCSHRLSIIMNLINEHEICKDNIMQYLVVCVRIHNFLCPLHTASRKGMCWLATFISRDRANYIKKWSMY